jgi:hypothetical protein
MTFSKRSFSTACAHDFWQASEAFLKGLDRATLGDDDEDDA